MRRCPNCNLSIPKKVKKCKFCGAIINKEVKDQIESLPDIIKKPNKITKTESLENTKEIKINPIPLKVKPITAPRDIEKETTQKKKQFKFLSSLKIILVILLLLVNTILITKVISGKEEEKKPKEKIKEVEHTTSNVLGNWRSSNNGLFAFEDNNNFFWYEYYDDLKNNYYKGTYNYKKGLEALQEMGYSEQEFTNTFGNDIKIDNVYSLNLLPTYSFKAGNNMTEEDLTENESWWFILMIKNDGTAIAYNKTLDLRYNLVKN